MSQITEVKVKRPALHYHGGKWRLAKWIIGHFPAHRVYVEPYGGAASVLLQKPRSHREIYNDLDGEIAQKVNRSQESVANAIRLLKLPEEVVADVRAGRLTKSHARALASYVDYPAALECLRKAALEGATTQEIERPHMSVLEDARACKVLFDALDSECTTCEKTRRSAQDFTLCLDVHCYGTKDRARKAARRDQEQANWTEKHGDAIDLSNAKQGGYAEVGGLKCPEDCEHRKVGFDRYDSSKRVVCFRLDCVNERMAARETRRLEKVEAECTGLRRKLVAMVRNPSEGTLRLMTATLLVEEIGAADPEVLEKLLADYGVTGVDLTKAAWHRLPGDGRNAAMAELAKMEVAHQLGIAIELIAEGAFSEACRGYLGWRMQKVRWLVGAVDPELVVPEGPVARDVAERDYRVASCSEVRAARGRRGG